MTDREYLEKLSGTFWVDFDNEHLYTIDELFDAFKDLQKEDAENYGDYTFADYIKVINPRQNGTTEQCYYVEDKKLQNLVDGDLFVTRDGHFFHRYPENQYTLNHYGFNNGCSMGYIDDLKESR